MPLAAYGGRRDVMSVISPLGPVYQAGTLSGNPLAVAAALATIATLDDALYHRIDEWTDKMQEGLETILREKGVPGVVQCVGSMFTLFFTDRERVRSWDDAKTCDTARFGAFHSKMLEKGIYLPPSQFEAAFVSVRHGDRELDQTLSAARYAIG
jgi:glutamate-1-semialdehyde 2,1-aminomutase